MDQTSTIMFIANLALSCMGTLTESSDATFRDLPYNDRAVICSCSTVMIARNFTPIAWEFMEQSKDPEVHKKLVNISGNSIEVCYKIYREHKHHE
jgi:hypothetical protein